VSSTNEPRILTDEEIAIIDARWSNVGPWSVSSDGTLVVSVGGAVAQCRNPRGDMYTAATEARLTAEIWAPNAEKIAAAPEDVRGLIATLRAKTKECDRWRTNYETAHASLVALVEHEIGS
jgi:hypothetical protein